MNYENVIGAVAGLWKWIRVLQLVQNLFSSLRDLKKRVGEKRYCLNVNNQGHNSEFT